MKPVIEKQVIENKKPLCFRQLLSEFKTKTINDGWNSILIPSMNVYTDKCLIGGIIVCQKQN